MKEQIHVKGDVEVLIEWENGRTDGFCVANTILKKGRQALAKVLAGDIGNEFAFHITKMLFGENGTQGGVKKHVNAGRNGLFGVIRLEKPVISHIDNSVPEQVIITSIVRFNELNNITLNEMATQMANGDLYSMTTFPDLNKTIEMQLTFNWRILFI